MARNPGASAKHFGLPLVLRMHRIFLGRRSRAVFGLASRKKAFGMTGGQNLPYAAEGIAKQPAGNNAIQPTGAATRLRRNVAAIPLAALLLPLTACNGFFQCEKASCPALVTTGTSSTTTNTGDYAYVANSAAGTTYLSEYSLASGQLNALGTISLGFIPVALAVAPSNGFLYVASAPGATNPGIYLYAISSTGTLSLANNGAALATDTVASMAISPDGNYLFTVNSDGLTLAEYTVNTSTGLLTLAGDLTLPGTSCSLGTALPVSQSCSVAVSPSKEYVVASLGISGDAVYSYTSTGGIANSAFATIPSGYSTSDATGDFSVALDANNYAYIAQTGSVSVFGITSLTDVVDEGKVTYPAGSVPRSITLSQSNSFVYTANEGAGTISGFAVSGSGSLNEITGSPVAGPANVSALGMDNSGDYMVAVGYDAGAGVRLYSIGSSGALTQVAEAGSGTNDAYPALVAMTH